MPLYEYECEDCGLFEEFNNINKCNDDVKCIKCGKMSKRILSNPTFHLKGSGWSEEGYSKRG